MSKGVRTVVVATRVSTEQRALLEAAAALEDVSVCEFVYRVVLPAVHERLSSLKASRSPQVAAE